MSTLIPKTRLEQFLAKIAGRDVTIEPKTRLEKFLAKIAGETIDITPKTRLEQLLNDIEVGGGGGSSDFSTATLTIDNQSSSDLAPQSLPVVFPAGALGEGSPAAAFPTTFIGINAGSSAQYNVILYNGKAILDFQPGDLDVRLSGDISVDGGLPLMTGDATIKVNDIA